MPEIIKDNRAAFSRMFGAVDRLAARNVESVARETADRFFRRIMEKQPIGKPDPLVEAKLSDRPIRPSVRHGTVPISEGWLGGPAVVRQDERTVDIILSSQSQHVKFFTMLTGRSHLGTTASEVTATQAEFLHFMWRGIEFKSKSSNPKGFTPASDFIKDAWVETSDFMLRLLGDSLHTSLLAVAKRI